MNKNLNVVKISLLSRATTFFLQIFFNLIIPDHSPDVFQSPNQDDVTIADSIISRILGGFKRWDAQYFLHIARYGYTYENALAFFPLYPYFIYYLASFLDAGLNYFLSFHSVLLVSGVLVNIVCFIIATVALHGLSSLVLKDRRAADVSVVLFCINPATVFFSACYSECLFSMLTFTGMWYLEKNNVTIASFLFGLSSAARSNGILLSGFVMHKEIKSLINKMQILHDMPTEKFSVCMQWIVTTTLKLILCIFPFITYQLYSCLLYCFPQSLKLSWPYSITEYAAQRGYQLPGENPGAWCYQSIPFSYHYVQSHYWNVGFLQYYELKQIPNFLLCSPLVIIIITAAIKYYQQNRDFCISLGFKSQKKKHEELYNNEGCFLYIAHAAGQVIICFLCIHVQVITRLLASSSPVFYWIAARIITEEISKDYPTDKNDFAYWLSSLIPISNNYITWHKRTTKLVVIYFIVYFVLGIAAHVNYLPWT